MYRRAEQGAEAYTQKKKALLLQACTGAKIIGMTSTFAALNRDLVHRLAPRVVIIEEAGELLECQLMACLSSPKLEHVVMIGDHQQLRPKINAFELCRKNHFDISLFERLINLNVPFAKLSTQLRMRPEVSQLVKHFYVDGLIDHERVKKYDRVGGVATDVYFLDHRKPEQSFEGTSKRNEHEAKLAVGLAFYLVRTQQYKPADITLLTPYIGQKRLMRNHLNPELRSNKKDGIEGVKVVSIDDYQGEENKVIILSLVRSNASRRIGFVGIENRVIVALSRAREGLYIIGNSEIFDNANSWRTVIEMLKNQGRIGPVLTLACRNHPDMREPIAKSEDFVKVKDGGCRQPCGKLLPRCGHLCHLNCHVFGHDQVACKQLCNRQAPTNCEHSRPSHQCAGCGGFSATPTDVCTYVCKKTVMVDLPCGHKKAARCHLQNDESHLKCFTKVDVVLPCGHNKQVRCYLADDADERKCFTTVAATLPCGHTQNIPCYMRDELHGVKCNTNVEVNRPCGHVQAAPCHQKADVEKSPCTESVEFTPACGHSRVVQCARKKAEENEPCETRVTVRLPCGHTRWCACRNSQQALSQLCEKQETVTLPCGHEQAVKCWQSKGPLGAVECRFSATVKAPCGHEVEQKCNRVDICRKRCIAKLPCGHPCGRKCRRSHDHASVVCEKDCRKELACGHICDNNCGAHEKLCAEECGLKCLHGKVCRKRCDEVCLPCTAQCAWQCSHYKCDKPCNELCERPRCHAKCRVKLSCGHFCSGLCGEPCPICPKCCPEVKCRISKKKIGQAVQRGSKLYSLPDCGHTFLVSALDKYMEDKFGSASKRVGLPRCVCCKARVQRAPRYGNIIKQQLKRLSSVKEMASKGVSMETKSICLFAAAHWQLDDLGHLQPTRVEKSPEISSDFLIHHGG
ncbi:hypothetical protein FOZ63_005792 [Perkinsus olseni]|uniref:NF-X1-type domain-containing protein n=1 Tax=Perkinsus olseni TaxID=32597 RepID=A0A7J6Q6E0_PEROL|nr:hypothetical protein FOZ63_005792 [Perkinsus olseni]KAF4737526.1 hypothetical protein FOZ62_002320 [Perkinsus olseni]